MQPVGQTPPPPPPLSPPARSAALNVAQQADAYRADWGSQPAAPAPVAAGEGLASFAEGALAGNFSDNHSWSATAGQVAMGFVPVAGQIADIRDTAASIGQIARGEAGGWLNLGASVIGFVPGIGDAAKAAIRSGGNVADGATDFARATARQAEAPTLQPAPRADAPPPTPPVAGGTSAAADDAPSLYERAQLAGDVYNAVPAPPAGFRAASTDEIRALGVDPALLGEADKKGFFARVYAEDTPTGTAYTVAFRGTNPSSMSDIATDAKQAFGADSVHYAKALEIGKQLQHSGAEVTLVGHSLGGGLAAEAAIASGKEATTFNAAGLHGKTIANAEAAASGKVTPGEVDNYRVQGEALTTLQESAAARAALGATLGAGAGSVVPGIGTLIGGIVGGVGAGSLSLPKAFGDQHTMPYVKPDGASWYQNNPINRHMIDAVLASTAAYAGR